MKKISLAVRTGILLSFSSGLLYLFSGCFAAGAAVEGLAASTAARAIFVNAAVTESVVGAEMAALMTRGFVATAAGLAISDATAANAALNKIRLKKVYGESPTLYIDGRPQPIAEIYAKSGRMKILKTGDVVPVPDYILSVEQPTILLKKEALFSSETVATVKQGDLLVKLNENKGWYQVSIVQGSKAFKGWVPGVFTAVVALATSTMEKEEQVTISRRAPDVEKPKEHSCAEALTGDYTFTNRTNKIIFVSLFPASTPTEYLGNPGMTGELITLSRNQSKSFFNLRSGVYKYWIREDGRANGTPVNQTLEDIGQIRVETCKTQNYVIQ